MIMNTVISGGKGEKKMPLITSNETSVSVIPSLGWLTGDGYVSRLTVTPNCLITFTDTPTTSMIGTAYVGENVIIGLTNTQNPEYAKSVYYAGTPTPNTSSLTMRLVKLPYARLAQNTYPYEFHIVIPVKIVSGTPSDTDYLAIRYKTSGQFITADEYYKLEYEAIKIWYGARPSDYNTTTKFSIDGQEVEIFYKDGTGKVNFTIDTDREARLEYFRPANI